MSIEAQSSHNPEMRVPSETEPALVLLANQLDQITQVSE